LALWAAARGALYPWHGLSQVLDHDPGNLPPGIESTVADRDAADMCRPARASTEVLATVARRPLNGTRPTSPPAMADYVTRVLFGTNGDRVPARAHLP
jgi:hypothetical protein